MSDWDAHDRFFGALEDAGVLLRAPTRGGSHRVAGSSVTVDSIPFGGIEAPHGSVRMPSEHVMTVTGFDDVLLHALPVDIGDNVVVRIASLPGLVMLKLIAWSERGHVTGRDAVDVAHIARHYGTVHRTRLIGAEADVFATEEYDLGRAGHRLLGRDMSALASTGPRALVERVLQEAIDPGTSQRLVNVMTGMDPEENEFERNETTVRTILSGLRDRS